ncbi:MAG: hypothetical protein ABR543_02085 [Gemmatimonadaceae bacterium]
MSETRHRFLRAIAETIGAERVEEVRLFQPMRQGGQESGVAIIAASVAPSEGSDSAPEVMAPRLTVYRASYLLTRKGPERGRWEVDVTSEAEAPLETLADVARGVHRRSGDDAEPERLTGNAFRSALAEESWIAPR